MGFLKSLFGGKKDNNQTETTVSIKTIQEEQTPLKEVSSSFQDLIALSLAPNYKIDENNFPDYFRYKYNIGFPKEKFKELEKNGYIRKSTAIETLPNLKITELKSIISKFDLKSSGNKGELCSRIIENVPESELSEVVLDRYWVVTESGKALLDENNYIDFYLEKHKYSLEEVGIDISAYEKLFFNKPNASVRDIVWGELNRLSLDYYNRGTKKGEFYDYCLLLHTMALFLEEENRHKEALATYIRYLFYHINFYAAFNAMRHYSVTKNINIAINTLYVNAEIVPFMAIEIKEIISGCELSSSQFQAYMQDAFSKENDVGAFSPLDLSNFVMCGLNGDRDGQMKICSAVMNSIVKKFRK